VPRRRARRCERRTTTELGGRQSITPL